MSYDASRGWDDSNGVESTLITQGTRPSNLNGPVGREKMDSKHRPLCSNEYNSSGLIGCGPMMALLGQN